ncbi:c8orf76 [Trichonephila clavata]|uniref:C8orf76 n=1 Tax=Trichonephila clavata TaxID=2740835 RepID=A0A8X6IJX7_TRICU|nr:c8orf76 [Trichonephila clavata]
MDIGIEFEEDFFEKPKDKRANEPPNYEAKFCVPLWFMDSSLAESESTDVLTTLKHQADYYYFTKNYPKAIETYKRCLELVPSSNNTWKREFMENLARAFLQVDDAEKALEWSLKLDKSSFSPDQKLISMNLLATVCHKLQKFEEELEALHHCLEANKLCPEFWLRLGLCYAGLYKIALPEYSMTVLCEKLEACCAFRSRINSIRQSETQENNTQSPNLVCSAESATSESSSEVFNNKCYDCLSGTLMVSSCLIHTRMLIDSGGPNHLAVERDERMKEKISNSLKHMEVNQLFIDAASEMLGPNFIPGLAMHDNTSEDSNSLTTNQNKMVQE